MDRDPEHEALVRIELERVRAAFGSLNQRQRTILLGEIGEAALEASTPAQKMARMRARRRLRSLLEDASGVIALSYLKIRRVIGDTDAAFAGTAARLGMRVAALATVAAVTAPVAGGDSSAAPIRPAEPPAVERDVVAHRSTSGAAASRVPLSPEPDDRSSGRFTGDATVAGERLNRHFGVIHRDDESIAVGGEPRVGPYGAEHSVAHEIAGSIIGAGAEARFDRTRCLNERLQRPRSRCRGNGRLRARARAVVNETGHEASVDTLVVPN